MQGTNYLFPLITLPYLIRMLGSDSFGIYAMILAGIQYVNIIVDFGFNFTATKLISIYKNNENEKNKIFTATIIIKFILFCLCLSVLLLLSLVLEQGKYIQYIIIGFIAVIGNMLLPVWFFQGIERMSKIALFSTLSKLSSLLFIFFTVKSPDDVGLAIASYSLGLLFTGLLSVYVIFHYKYVKFTKVSLKFIIKLAKDSVDMFISNITVSFYTTLNTILVGAIAGPATAGYFSAADKLRIAVQGLLTPLQQAIFPRVTSLINNDYKLNDVLKTFGYKMIGFGFFLSLSIAIIGVPLSEWYFGNNNAISSKILLILSPLPFVVSIGIVFGQWWLITTNRTRIIRKVYFNLSMLHVFIAYFLIKHIPNYGVAISIVFTETIISLLLTIFAIKNSVNH